MTVGVVGQLLRERPAPFSRASCYLLLLLTRHLQLAQRGDVRQVRSEHSGPRLLRPGRGGYHQPAGEHNGLGQAHGNPATSTHRLERRPHGAYLQVHFSIPEQLAG